VPFLVTSRPDGYVHLVRSGSAEVVLLPRWLPEYGAYVRTGDVVEWLLRRDIDREHLKRSYGQARTATITGIHDPEDEPRPTDQTVRGRVRQIFSVTCGMRPDATRPGWLESIPESAVYEERQAMQRTEGFDLPEDQDWAGYVVKLEPTRPDEE
jgi:hypothetical protein